jgi:hypothetical protein
MTKAQKDIVRIFVGFMAVTACLALAFCFKFPVAELFLVILFALGIAILSFFVLGKLTGSVEIFNLSLKTVTGGFAIFVIIIVVYFQFEDKLFKLTNYNKELIEISRPSNTQIWEKISGDFKMFNAPFAFANTSHFTTKLKWFKNPGFRMSILMFDATDISLHKDFKGKFKRMRSFISRLSQAGVNCRELIEIKVYHGTNIPSTSFFTTPNSLSGRPYSIMYMSKQQRPPDCLFSESATFEAMLEGEFNNFWTRDSAISISIAKLLDSSIHNNSPLLEFYDPENE